MNKHDNKTHVDDVNDATDKDTSVNKMNNVDIHVKDNNVNTKADKQDKDKNQKIKKIKILQMNKGTADLENKADLVNFNIKENGADIIFLSEANHKFTDDSKKANLKKIFKGFRIEESRQIGQDSCRCLMLIRNRINYERLDFDESENPAIAIKLKTKKHQFSTILGHYRQWKMPGEGHANDHKGIKRQKSRLENLHLLRKK